MENFNDSCFPTEFLPNPTRITFFNMIIRSFQYDHRVLMVVKLSGSQKSHRGVWRLPRKTAELPPRTAEPFWKQESPKFSPKIQILVENFDDSCFPTKFGVLEPGIPQVFRQNEHFCGKLQRFLFSYQISTKSYQNYTFQYDHQKLSV